MAIADRMKIGIGSPHIFPDDVVDMTFAASFARRAEELGYASLWTQERVTGSPTTLHPLSFLAWLAGQTTTARIGVSVLVLPRHNPVLLAKLAADIDVISGGRLVFGVGLGNSASELPMYGITAERRVTRFVEQVEAIRALWTQNARGPLRHVLRSAEGEHRAEAGAAPASAHHLRRERRRRHRAQRTPRRRLDGRRQRPARRLPDARWRSCSPTSRRQAGPGVARGRRRVRALRRYYYGNADNAEHAAIWGSAAPGGVGGDGRERGAAQPRVRHGGPPGTPRGHHGACVRWASFLRRQVRVQPTSFPRRRESRRAAQTRACAVIAHGRGGVWGLAAGRPRGTPLHQAGVPSPSPSPLVGRGDQTEETHDTYRDRGRNGAGGARARAAPGDGRARVVIGSRDAGAADARAAGTPSPTLTLTLSQRERGKNRGRSRRRERGRNRGAATGGEIPAFAGMTKARE